MLLQQAPVSQPADAKMHRIGVGIDTSRYGHYAAFLRDDLQPAAGELQFVESAAGYAQLRTRLEQIVSKLGTVHFAVRLSRRPRGGRSPSFSRPGAWTAAG